MSESYISFNNLSLRERSKQFRRMPPPKIDKEEEELIFDTAIFNAWKKDPVNMEIGGIYENHVMGESSIDMMELLDEYHSENTGGAVRYSADVKKFL